MSTDATVNQSSEDESPEVRAAREKFPTASYSDHVLSDIFEDAKRLFLDAMIDVDCAHAVMLGECRIITGAEASALLSALAGLDRERIRAAVYDGSFEDLFFYIQSLITEICGEDVAGRLHTARSRNDIDVTIYRIRLRSDILSVLRGVLDLRGVMLAIAARHHETLMPAYTHTQPAQPTTLAHFMLAMAEVLGRDIERLRRAYEGANHSPLGACAITTTGFPIDRQRTAELLGFDAPTVNSYASISAVDYFTESLGALSVLLVNTGKFAQEFLLMATREFDAIRLSDGYVQISSIMPQKRNPVALEHVRALASKALGQSQGVFLSVHNTPFGDINDVEDDLQPLIANAFRDARRSISLFAAALSTATFNVAVLRERAGRDFITVTELADTIVRSEGLPFRAAHHVVAKGVGLALEGGQELTHSLLQAVAREVLGRELRITPEEVRIALDPEQFVRVRTILGGPAPEETRRALDGERMRERANHQWYDETLTALERSKENLGALTNCGTRDPD
ncbi:MAG: argininosuccinate lyase [Acidobacteriota bacterium]|nr:argininosuccinate lyase [Acidobacteriota bacterium]